MVPEEVPNQDNTDNQPRPLSLLAAETYGTEYYGKTADEPAPTDPNDPPQDPPQDPPVSEDDPPSDEEDEEEHEEEEEDDEHASEDEEVPISSLGELVEAQEWDPEWAQSLKVPVKIDGAESEVPIKDLVDNYQMGQAAEKRLEEAKSKAKSVHEEAAHQKQAIEESYAAVVKLVKNAEQMLDSDSSGIDWKRLREDDPAEYSAKKAEIAERREQIENLKKQAVEEYRQGSQQNQQQSEEQFREHLQREHQRLVESIPEWSDDKKAAEGKAAVARYLMDSGFAEQDVMGASDHRLIVLARKAMLHDSGKQRTEAAKKQVKKVPKMMKPGTPKSKKQANQDQVAAKRERFKKTRTLDDAFEVLKARRLGGD